MAWIGDSPSGCLYKLVTSNLPRLPGNFVLMDLPTLKYTDSNSNYVSNLQNVYHSLANAPTMLRLCQLYYIERCWYIYLVQETLIFNIPFCLRTWSKGVHLDAKADTCVLPLGVLSVPSTYILPLVALTRYCTCFLSFLYCFTLSVYFTTLQ